MPANALNDRKPEIRTLSTTAELAEFCELAKAEPYVTLDTEFLRERTYYSKLCLIQAALPPASATKAAGGLSVLIDPLVEGLSLEPLYDLFRHKPTVKVFHAARQDLEIFFHDAGVMPDPLFDTQIAAMVCGFGEQVGYETLVKKIARQPLDKSSRFTDWSHRPLSDAQAAYALADVTHLRAIYEFLSAQLDKTGRAPWLAEEVAVLLNPETYITRPEEAWERVRTRSGSPRFLAVVRELARFRETYAQERDIPRARVFKDDALIELASTKPLSEADLAKSRLLLRDARRGEIANGILSAVKAGVEARDLPKPAPEEPGRPGNAALADLLRVLLKAKADAAGVAPRLIASASDLDAIASGARDLPALHGWRAEVFGHDALRLASGEIALSAQGGAVKVVACP
ncbi:ribonuclease D [Paracoccus denitrificans]|jgi:ribonuclease D|uniref:Ribonuclease D n=1 Tax=Paracoccus denitrificans (strain Pd 1222) TaxID=318586 RepID=A1B391_PARDP|nr:ribonuclease D [Paracoccus denitrificans]ABL69985.1 ribonuclease D [Paracoccus denitrificans PD1222]MBB4627067.1 ribonuclease D [Paracoccus denitrificans]QAR25370.1 ribonuclease D [Paracoccus denitrificans]SDI15166.1 ribonuclease D [Paracoccus denitrificans]SFQ99635.1 ribonuclease D [Paracoccus denitrificans]